MAETIRDLIAERGYLIEDTPILIRDLATAAEVMKDLPMGKYKTDDTVKITDQPALFDILDAVASLLPDNIVPKDQSVKDYFIAFRSCSGELCLLTMHRNEKAFAITYNMVFRGEYTINEDSVITPKK